MAVILFVAGMGLLTAHNDFRYYYHPDEKGKVWQIADGERNCNHPLMMLTATKLVSLFHWGPLTDQEIVQKGRTVSAFFATMAAVAMALLARRMAGAVGGSLAAVLGGWSAGVLILMDARLFDLAHFMKEDPALVMGMALTFLALHVFWTRRDEASVLFVGVAVATAVSGKYVGWLLVPFAIGIVRWGCEPAARRRYTKLLLISFGVAWAVLNYSLLFDPIQPFKSVAREMKGVIGGHHGLTRDVPHSVYLQTFLDLPMAITLLFGVYIVGLLARIRKVAPAEWLVPGFALLLAVMMSFSPKSSSRYFLPVELVVCFGAGLGVAWASTWLASFCGRARPAILTAAWVLIFGAAIWNVSPGLQAHYRAMTIDDRNELKTWIAQNLPPAAVIAEDGRVHLPAPGIRKYEREPKLLQSIWHGESAADGGTIRELRAMGVTHIAIDSATFTRYGTLTPTNKKANEFTTRKAFYASLGVLPNSTPLPEIRQVWASSLGINMYLQPGIQLFDITAVVPADQSGN